MAANLRGLNCSPKDLARQVFAEFQPYFVKFYSFHEIRCFDEESQIYWVGYYTYRQTYLFTVTQELFRVYSGDRKWVAISSIHAGMVTRARKTLADKMRKVLKRGLARAVIEEVVRYWGDTKWDWSNTVKVVIDRINDLYIPIHFNFNPKTGKIYVKMPVNTNYITYVYELKHYSELGKEIGKDILRVASDWREKVAALKAL